MKVFVLTVTLLQSAFSDLKVLSPTGLQELFTNSSIASNTANFGRIPYGQTLVGSLVFDFQNEELSDACQEFDDSF